MHSKVIAAYRETPIKSLTWWAEPKFVQTWKYNFLLCFGNEPPIWYNGLKFTISHVLRYNHTWCEHCWTRIGHLVPETNLFHAPDSIMSCMSHVLWIACSSFKYWMAAWVIVGHWRESNVVQLQLRQVVKYHSSRISYHIRILQQQNPYFTNQTVHICKKARLMRSLWLQCKLIYIHTLALN